MIGTRAPLSRWRKRVFLYATMLSATEFFRIPSNRAAVLGGQVEL